VGNQDHSSSRDLGGHPVSVSKNTDCDAARIAEGMPNVSFSAREFRVKLSNGRVVCVGRSDDAEHWSFRFGHPTNDADAVTFALGNEAMAALATAIKEHARPEAVQRWVVEIKPPDTLADGPLGGQDGPSNSPGMNNPYSASPPQQMSTKGRES
jgi:hypothetical protein